MTNAVIISCDEEHLMLMRKSAELTWITSHFSQYFYKMLLLDLGITLSVCPLIALYTYNEASHVKD